MTRSPTPHELELAGHYRAGLTAYELPLLAEHLGPVADLPVAVGIVPEVDWWHCPAIHTTAGAVFAMLLDPLDEAKGKLLPLFVPSEIKTRGELQRRIGDNVRAAHFYGLDYDKGDAPLDVLETRIAELGWCGVCYRTPSDGKNTSEILRGRGLITDPGFKELCAPTPEAVLAKMVSEGYRADILGAITIIDPARVESEIVSVKIGRRRTKHEVVRTKIVVQHNPLSKSRFVGVLSEPFKRRNSETTREFNGRWRNVIESVVAMVGFVADPQCKDPNRCFYLPSSRLPTDDVCRYVLGQPLDVKTLPAPPPKVTKVRVAHLVGEGGNTKASGRYRLADLYREKLTDLVRGDKGDDFVTAECPYDDHHSDAGNPYDRAFWANNDGNCGCWHTHGADHAPADYVAKLLSDGVVTAADLEPYAIRTSNDLWKFQDKYLRKTQ